MAKKASNAKKTAKTKPETRGRKPGPKKDSTLCNRSGCKRKKDANHSEFCKEHAAERASYMKAYMQKKRDAELAGKTYSVRALNKKSAKKTDKAKPVAKKPVSSKKLVIKGKKLAKAGAKAKTVRKPKPVLVTDARDTPEAKSA